MTKSSMQLKSFVAPLPFMYGNIGHITDLVKHQPGCQNEMRMKKCNKVKNNIFFFVAGRLMSIFIASKR